MAQSTQSAANASAKALVKTTPRPAISEAIDFKNIGRPATPAEVKAWDIDVRSDFKGLPKGQGSVAMGERVWEAQCASCHGTFGESNEVFTPIVGNTTKKDIETGRVAALLPGANAPQRTTMMKLSSMSTLWDYINRAMPWTAPKSLTTNEVYAVTAYILHLADVVPADFTLSDQNMAFAQSRLPNRNGKTTEHAMWPGRLTQGQSKPDVQGQSCMTNCKPEVIITSHLPDYARNAHGNLAEQNRVFGPQRGAVTTQAAAVILSHGPLSGAVQPEVIRTSAAPAAAATPSAPPVVKTAGSAPASGSLKMADIQPLLNKYACTACHAVNARGIGPSFKAVVEKQGKRADAQAYLAGKIKSGGQGTYGQMPMPAQALSTAEAQRIAQWLTEGAN